MLEVKGLYKTFNPGSVNEKKALNGIDLTLNEGDELKSGVPFSLTIMTGIVFR